MTIAERIRIMSDDELADLFSTIMSDRDHKIQCQLHERGIDIDFIEMPAVFKFKIKEYLESEFED
jgi:hypothetical protein